MIKKEPVIAGHGGWLIKGGIRMVFGKIDNAITRRTRHRSRRPMLRGLLMSWQIVSALAMAGLLIFTVGWISNSSCLAQDVNNRETDQGNNQEHITPSDQPANETQDDNALTPEQEADFALWKSAMTESTDAVARRRAAGKLLASGWQSSLDFLSLLLQNKDQAGVITAIADAVSEQGNPPQDIFRPLLSAYERSEDTVRESLEIAITEFPPGVAIPEIAGIIYDKEIPISNRVALIGLLSRFVEVETIDALIPSLDKNEPAPLRQAAAKALATIAGVDLGGSRLRWQDWWKKHRNAGREGLLTANIARLQNELKAIRKRDRQYHDERTTLIASLTHWIEQAYALEPKDNRPGMVVSLLGDKQEEIRLLGLRLIEQAMSNGEPMPAEVSNAVAGCVNDASFEVRAGAVRQLIFLDGPRAGALAVKRLDSEPDLSVRLALEAALTRYPCKEGEALLLKRYLDAPGRAALENDERTAIAAALSAAFRVSTDPNTIQRKRIAQVVAGNLNDQSNEKDFQSIIAQLSSAEAGLLAWSPDEMARKICRMILTNKMGKEPLNQSENLQNKRLSVARELAASELDDEALYKQAADPAIHAIAFAVLRARRGSLKALAGVLHDFKVPDEITRQKDVAAVMTALPVKAWVAADDLLAASDQITIDQRATWLSRVLILDTAENTNNKGPSSETNQDNPTENTGETQNATSTEITGEGNSEITKGNATSSHTGDAGAGKSAASANIPIEDGMIRRQICLRLAELELKRGRPAQALIALKTAPAAQENQDHADHLLAVAKIAVGEFPESVPGGKEQDISVWLEALGVVDQMPAKDDKEISTRADRMKTIALKIRELGEDQLPQSDQARIIALLGDKKKQPGDNNIPDKKAGDEGW